MALANLLALAPWAARREEEPTEGLVPFGSSPAHSFSLTVGGAGKGDVPLARRPALTRPGERRRSAGRAHGGACVRRAHRRAPKPVVEHTGECAARPRAQAARSCRTAGWHASAAGEAPQVRGGAFRLGRRRRRATAERAEATGAQPARATPCAPMLTLPTGRAAGAGAAAPPEGGAEAIC